MFHECSLILSFCTLSSSSSLPRDGTDAVLFCVFALTNAVLSSPPLSTLNRYAMCTAEASTSVLPLSFSVSHAGKTTAFSLPPATVLAELRVRVPLSSPRTPTDTHPR